MCEKIELKNDSDSSGVMLFEAINKELKNYVLSKMWNRKS